MKINTYLMKSNKNNIFIPLCLAAFALVAILAACDRNEAEAEQRTDGPETAYLELDQIGVEGNVLSRATPATTDVPTTGTIGFFRKEANGYGALKHVKGTWKESKLKPGNNAWIPDPMIKVGTDDATMGIYYPYDERYNTSNSILLFPGEKGGPAGGVPDNDLVCERWYKEFQYNSLSSYSKTMHVELQQLYSKLKIELKRGTGFVGKPEWTNVKITSTNYNDISQGAHYYMFNKHSDVHIEDYGRTGAGANGLSIPLKSTITFSGETSTPVELLLIPGSLKGKLTIIITLGGKEMPISIDPATSEFNGEFAPGKQYNLTITVNPTDLEVASLQTKDWTNVNLTGQSTH